MLRFSLLLAAVFSLVSLVTGTTAETRENALQNGGQRATFAGAVSRVAPSVVNIYAMRRTAVAQTPKGPYAGDPLLQQLYGGRLPAQQNGQAAGQMRQKMERSLGSGVIVRAEGVVVTNLHVIAGAESVMVVLSDGREFPARFMSADEKTDIALMRLQLPTNTRLPVARFGDSSTLRTGDVVLALGNPYGIGQSVSMGVVSAVDRTNTNLSSYAQFIQTDAAINPGNSGGALIDSTGAVVGINTAIFTRTGGTMGISFAVPANLVRTVVDDIVSTGSVTRPWLGAEGRPLNPAMAERLGQRGGVLLNRIIPGSPAANAGLQDGDLILALDGKPIADGPDLNERLLATPNLVGRASKLTIVRDGTEQQVPIQFAALPPRNRASQQAVTGYSALSGVTLEQLSPALNVEFGLPLATTGVAVVALPQAPTPGVTLLPVRAGDVLRSINRQTFATVDQALEILAQSKRTWVVTLERNGKPLTLDSRNQR